MRFYYQRREPPGTGEEPEKLRSSGRKSICSNMGCACALSARRIPAPLGVSQIRLGWPVPGAVMRSKLEPTKNVTQTLRRHRELILNKVHATRSVVLTRCHFPEQEIEMLDAGLRARTGQKDYPTNEHLMTKISSRWLERALPIASSTVGVPTSSAFSPYFTYSAQQASGFCTLPVWQIETGKMSSKYDKFAKHKRTPEIVQPPLRPVGHVRTNSIPRTIENYANPTTQANYAEASSEKPSVCRLIDNPKTQT